MKLKINVLGENVEGFRGEWFGQLKSPTVSKYGKPIFCQQCSIDEEDFKKLYKHINSVEINQTIKEFRICFFEEESIEKFQNENFMLNFDDVLEFLLKKDFKQPGDLPLIVCKPKN